MDCPVCPTTKLVMAERQGIEIDYCPQCRGVWLDRGELDKIIERSAEAAPAAAPRPQATAPGYQSPPQPAYRHDDDDDRDRRHGGYQGHDGGYYKKKKGLLSELFDFD